MKSRRIRLTIFAGVLLSSLFNFGAAAHTELVTAIPKAEEKLDFAPEEVRLEFNEALLLVGGESPNQIEAFDSQGNLISQTTKVSGPIASVRLQIATGEIRVRYRVVGSDGHLVRGEYRFTVGSSIAKNVESRSSLPETGPNLLIRVTWFLLGISAIGVFALLRLRK